MKNRFLVFVLCLSLMLCALPFGAGAEDTVSWALEGGTLSITGSGAMAFETIPWADRLEEVEKLTLDEGITAIQDGAFAGCTALKSVTLSKKLRYIGDRAFEGCTALCWVTVPAGVIGIGERAFAGCTKLTSIDIPASVSRIGDNAFEKNIVCSGLKNSASDDYIKEFGGTFKQIDLHKPASGSGSFEKMTWSLNKGTLSVAGEGALNLGTLEAYPWDSLRADIETVEIAEGITQVDAQAFAVCRKLTKATLPESVTQIAENAFRENTELAGPQNSEAQRYAQAAGLKFTPLDSREQTPSLAAAEGTEASEAAAVTQTTEPAEMTESTAAAEAAETTESTAATEAAETTESTVATEAAETTEPTAAAETTEVTENTEAAAATGTTEATETTEPTETAAPVETTEPTAAAGEESRPTLTVGTVTGQPGQQVKLTISIQDNPGLCGLNFGISYDHSRLTLEDYDCVDGLLNVSDWSVGLGEGEKALWLQSDALAENGDLLTLVFRISDSAPLGKTEVTLTGITGVTEDTALVKPACAGGGVTVASGIMGDINGDGRVTAADEKRLRRFLAGAQVSIETGNADLNGDGSIDLLDLMLLQKRLSN